VFHEWRLRAESGRDRGDDEIELSNRGEVDEPDAVLHVRDELGRELERQTRLADSARPRQGHERQSFDQNEPQQVGDLLLPTEERLEPSRQVRVVQAAERRKTSVAELEEPELADVLQPVDAEVARAAAVQQVASRLRREHLPAVRCAHHTRGAMDVRADVAPVADDRLAGVDADPDSDRAAGERRDGLLGRRYCLPRRGERHEERVALGVDLDPAVPGESLAEHAAVLLEHVGVALCAELVEQPRRALDVREEQRHGAGRKLAHADRFARRRAGV
jgi:hypothetical protein